MTTCRRGKPTLHRAFDESTAILAGDLLHALAFEVLADDATHEDPFVRAELVLELARAAGPAGMAGGQMMDLSAGGMTLDLAAVTRLQQLKTGALIGWCLEAAAIMGRVPPEGRTALRGFARDLGLAFQIADDLLDHQGNVERAGKRVGKDQAAGKETFVSLLGAERAQPAGAGAGRPGDRPSSPLWRGGRPAPRGRPLRRRARSLSFAPKRFRGFSGARQERFRFRAKAG